MRRIALGLVIVVAVGLAAFLVLGPFDDDGGGYDAAYDAGETVEDREDVARLKGTGVLRPAEPTVVGAYVISVSVVDGDGKPLGGCRVGAMHRDRSYRDPRDPSTWTRPANAGWGLGAGTGYPQVDDPLADLFDPTVETETDAGGNVDLRVDREGSWAVRALVEAPLVTSSPTAWMGLHQRRSQVTVRVVEGDRLDGRVIDGQGRGVTAVVRGTVRGGEREWWTADPRETRASDGAFSYDALPPGEATFTVILPGRMAIHGLKTTLPREGVWTIRLDEAGGTVAGRVTDGGGQAVAGAQVLLRVGEDFRNLAAAARADTDADGRYRVEGVPEGNVLAVLVAAEGYGTYEEPRGIAPWRDAKVEAGQLTTIDVTLHRGATVAGTVREKGTGKPLPGVEVFLLARGDNGRGPIPNTKTDASGRYELSGATPGLHALVARSTTHYLPALARNSQDRFVATPWGMTSTAGPPPELFVLVAKTDTALERDFEMAPGLPLRGRVVGPDGEGVARAEVTSDEMGIGQVGWSWGVQWPAWGLPLAVTGSDGRFALDNLPPKDALALTASKPPLVTTEKATARLVAGEKPEEVLIRLTEGVAVEGRVLDADGIGVEAWLFASVSGPADGYANAQSKADGTFRVEALPPGDVHIQVSSGRSGGTRHTVKGLKAGETRRGVEIRLKEGVRVSGTVVDQHGKPLAHERITFTKGGDWSARVDVQTDEDGYFETDSAPEGKLRAQRTVMTGSVGHSEAFGQPFEGPVEGLRLVATVPEVAVVEGRVLRPDGTPVPVCRVYVTPAGPGGRGGRNVYGEGGDMADVPWGEFRKEVRGDPPFEVHVSAARDERGRPLNLGPKKVRVDDPGAGPVEIRLARGKEIRGRVVDAEGDGVEDVQVHGGGPAVTTDADGKFRLTGLGEEKITLRVVPGPGWAPPPTRTATPGDEVEIVLHAATAVAGRILDADGKAPTGHVIVNASWPQSAGKPPGYAHATAQRGNFRVEGIPFGARVTLRVQVYGSSVWSAPTTFTVDAGDLDLELTLGSGARLAGVVVDEAGEPVAGVSLQVRKAGETPGPPVWANTNQDGKFEVTGLEPGAWQVTVRRPSTHVQATVVDVVVPDESVRIVLPEERPISGRLVGDGALEGWRVRAWAPGNPSMRLGAQSTVGTDGAFEVKGLGEGRVVLGAWKLNDDRYALSEPLEPGTTGVSLRLVEGARIEGTAHDASGALLGRAWVYATNDAWRAYARVEENGRFVLRGLPPGTYECHVRPSGAQGEGSKVQVSTGSTNVQLTGP